MRKFSKRTIIFTAAALISFVLAVGRGAGVYAESEGESREGTGREKSAGEIVVRLHGNGTVKLTDWQGRASVMDSDEKTVSLPAHSFIRLDAEAAEETAISITVTTEDGIEMEPESLENGLSYAREITVSEVTKIVDVTFGKPMRPQARAALAAARGSERFPEKGDQFSGV